MYIKKRPKHYALANAKDLREKGGRISKETEKE